MNTGEKYGQLQQWLLKKGKVAVAFSGGVDSTFILSTAKKVLDNRVIAFTIKTPYIPDWELAEAIEFCKSNAIEHIVISSDIIPEIASNPVNRCYLCKRHLFTLLKSNAGDMGYTCILDGSNADDSEAYRPGLAALRELEICSPLLEMGITKAEVRRLSSETGLPTAEKPSYACLLTRLPYDYTFSIPELNRIEKAELFLSSIGFAGSRVRNHGNIARIETDKEKITDLVRPVNADKLTGYFHEIGYEHITVDLEGYRSGSFDKNTNKQQNGQG
jgi:uncharacterized protein